MNNSSYGWVENVKTRAGDLICCGPSRLDMYMYKVQNNEMKDMEHSQETIVITTLNKPRQITCQIYANL